MPTIPRILVSMPPFLGQIVRACKCQTPQVITLRRTALNKWRVNCSCGKQYNYQMNGERRLV